ncbi:DUF7010 family protein [Halalkalibacillus halophilus]|uniref:DUF7010 family protein n=1 Tax=Halalkalibacillus halophilus TaxID=392827 RepID=UPI00048766BC|nr:hypothetical protein [Halalkalibacillus halophilus]
MSQSFNDLNEIRKDLSIRGKNGIPFILAAIIIWSIVTVIFLLPLDLHTQNIAMLFSTGLMFPLAILFSSVMKADWKLENNPFANLGVILNVAQLMYFPVIVWAISVSPEQAVVFFAIIVGAHFFPYGWFYNAKGYYVMAPVISVVVLFIEFIVGSDLLWVVPLSTAVLLGIVAAWLYNGYRRKLD